MQIIIFIDKIFLKHFNVLLTSKIMASDYLRVLRSYHKQLNIHVCLRPRIERDLTLKEDRKTLIKTRNVLFYNETFDV